MALINDPRLYSGGSERLDSRPHVQLYAQLKQREQARNDAYDEYIRGLNKNINPAGMRNQERAVFEDKLKQWQEFGMKNKEALRNPRKDNGAASMQFQSGYQDLQNLIAESKGEEEKKKPLIEIMTDPAKRDRLDENEVFPRIQVHDQPLYTKDTKTGQWMRDPNRKSFNVADINFNPKPFDQNAYFRSFDDVKKSDLAPVITKDPKNMMQTVTTTSVFDREAKDLVATRAVGQLFADKGFRKVVDQLNKDEYNDFFKEQYGRDIQNEADLAAAYTLKALQQKTVKSEMKDDIFARQKEMEAIRNANRVGLLKLKDSMDDQDDATNDLWYDIYIDQLTMDAKKNQSRLHPGAGLGWEIPLDPFLSKNLSKDGISPDKLVVTTEGKYVPIFYKRDDNGAIVRDEKSDLPKENQSQTAPIERNQLKVSLGGKSGVKQLNKEMSAGKQTLTSKAKYPLPKGKPRMVQQEGVTYTWNEETGEYQ